MTKPPNPPPGEMIWNVLAASGMDWNTAFIFSANSLVWSSVELAEAWTMVKTTPWSSVGASSFCEKM